MSEIKIQNPCENCELKYMLDDEESMRILALEGLYMAMMEKDSLLACKHPWRLLYKAYLDNPSAVQEDVLGKVVQVRGKNPEDYGLPSAGNIGTLDF